MTSAREATKQLADPDLVFLVSQPRAGSTLLQKILAAHPEVTSGSEPWLMLPPTAVLRPGSVTADYDAEWAAVGLESFIDGLPGGRETYLTGLRRMYGYLYDQALVKDGGRVFLDKTPRYYLIIPHLLEIFPRARIILLVRNPLAVLVSMVNTWSGIAPGCLHPCRDDLLEAPRLLVQAVQEPHERLRMVQYERVLESPEATLRELCVFLGLEFQADMLQYGSAAQPRWALGDQRKVYAEQGIDVENRNQWIAELQDPLVWRLCSDYLDALGEERYAALGYSWKNARQTLSAARPGTVRRWFTLSLRSCLKPPAGGTVWRRARDLVLRQLGLARAPR